MNSVELVQLDDIKQSIPELSAKMEEVNQFLNPDEKKQRIKELADETLKEGFWDDQEKAQSILKEKTSLESKVSEYEKAKLELEDLPELIDMTVELGEEDAVKSIVESYQKINDAIEKLTLETLLDGEYDSNNAILSIHYKDIL